MSDTKRGAALKAIEDRLDLRICAWLASRWAHDQSLVPLFGDSVTGHIAVGLGMAAT